MAECDPLKGPPAPVPAGCDWCWLGVTGAGRCDWGCQPACSVCGLALGLQSAKVLSDNRERVLVSSSKRTNKRAIMDFRAPGYLP